VAGAGNLVYHGGPLISHPQVYVVFWGDWSPAGDPNDESDYLANFLSVVGATPWLDTVNQYAGGGSSVNMLAGEWNDTSTVPGTSTGTIPTQTDVQNEVYKAIQFFGFPTNTVGVETTQNNIVLVVTPIYNVPSDNGCGYHSTTIASTSEPYDVPWIYEPYGRSGCSAKVSNPHSTAPDDLNGVNDGVSIGVGHELAETITDPQPFSGWLGPASEIGDECQATSQDPYGPGNNSTMGRGGQVGTDIFPVQPLWSNANGGCVMTFTVWSGWSTALGEPSSGVVLPSPAVASWGPDRLDLFTIDANGSLEHRAWNGSSWNSSGWQPVGSTPALSGSPAAVSWGPNRIDMFAVDTAGSIVHQWWTGTGWSGWRDEIGHPSGVTVYSPTVSSWSSGRLDVFATGSDGNLWHAWYDGSWHYWQSLGGLTGWSLSGAPAAVSWGPNRIDIFSFGTDGNIYQKTWNGSWSSWTLELPAPTGGPETSPAVSSWGPGRLDIFVTAPSGGVGSGGPVWHDWYAGGVWHAWGSNGGTVATRPGAVSWLPGRIDLFGTGADFNVWSQHFG
jgi:hypothetical protein